MSIENLISNIKNRYVFIVYALCVKLPRQRRYAALIILLRQNGQNRIGKALRVAWRIPRTRPMTLHQPAALSVKTREHPKPGCDVIAQFIGKPHPGIVSKRYDAEIATGQKPGKFIRAHITVKPHPR